MPSAGAPYEPVKSGTDLWHVYKEPYAATRFNPFANGRFAARKASPPRAMFYAGETSDCALWETVLRDVFPHARPPHPVDLPPLAGYHITRVRLKGDVEILDLGRLGVRWIARDDLKRRDRITALTTVPKYTATHKEAEKLLADFPRAAGLLWPSKQTGEDGAYLFYDPPLSSGDFEAIESVRLESPAGMSLVDHALARAGMRRLDSAALVAQLEAEIPLDPADDKARGAA
jgi:hypothetical protein